MPPVRFGLLLTALITGCSGQPGPAGVSADQAGFVSLYELDPAELTIAPDSRGGSVPPASLPLAGPWKYAGATRAGMHKWTTPIPIRPRGLFFHNPSPGMSLVDRAGKELRYARFGNAAEPFWSHNRKVVIVYTPDKGQPPAAGDYVFSYPKAVERERALNFALQAEGTQEIDFVRSSVHHDWNTRTGLLLPAPAEVVWELRMPPAAELLMAPGVTEPELLDGPASDGATLIVSVEADGATTEAGRFELEPGSFPMVKLDLSPWGGQDVRLRFSVDPGSTPAFDYAFIGDPMISSRRANPRRVVMVFIDTLRADHLGTYGYHRETSVKLDRWAENAVVFENARSVAPWTLPSGRAIVTGRHPEYYHSTDTIQKTLRGEGFVSAMFAGNVYLSTNFEMARDWGWHKVGMWPRAETITDDALAFFAATEGHDAILQVHYMDPHLPYLEPKAYRKLFAGAGAGGLGEEFYLPDVRRARQNDAEMRQYVIDRYDNNVRYATDEVVRLLSHLDDNDVAVVYADHGEEFWDHDGFEHGHQLYDELLHVPLILSAPGLEGRRVDAPASLIDLTPTLLDALGVSDEEDRDGISLMPAALGEAAGVEAMRNRSLAFGRPLYGSERWGVLTEVDGGWQKWMTHDGAQEAYDVAQDPKETQDLLKDRPPSAAAPYHAALGEALHTEAGVAWRLVASFTRAELEHDLIVRMEVPGGVDHFWVEHDPVGLAFAEASVEVVAPVEEGGEPTHVVVTRWPSDKRAQATVWVVPSRPIHEATGDVRISATYGDELKTLAAPVNRGPNPEAVRGWIASTGVGKRTLRFGFGIAPVPPEGALGVSATDEEMSEELEAIGYKHDDEDEATKPDPKPAP